MCYRRTGQTEYDWFANSLMRRYGESGVFYDRSSIKHGEWPEVIARAQERMSTFLLVVGRGWEDIVEQRRARRDAGGEADQVFSEIDGALARIPHGGLTFLVIMMFRNEEDDPFAKLEPRYRETLGKWQRFFISGNPNARDKLCEALQDDIESSDTSLPKLPGSRAGAVISVDPTVLPPLQSHYVGRAGLITDVVDMLASKASPCRIALYGMPGVGKSTLAALIARDKRVRHLFPDGIFFASIGKENVEGAFLTAFQSWIARLGGSPEQWERSNLPALGERVARAVDGKRCLFVIDDVHDDASAQRLDLIGARPTSLLPSRSEQVARHFTRTRKQVREVTPLSDDDSSAVLKLLARDSFEISLAVTARIDEMAKRFKGVPKALELFGRQIRDLPIDEKVALGKLDQLTSRDFDDLIEAARRGVSSFGRQILERVALLQPDPRTFTLGLARAVAGAALEDMSELLDSGLVQQFDGAFQGDDDTLDERIHFRMHQEVARVVASRDGETTAAVYKAACGYWSNRVDAFTQDLSESDFSKWSRHESATWREAVGQLRYYLLKAGDYDRLSFELTRNWLRGFWWWGCYTDKGFEFCNDLIASWPDDRIRQAHGGRADWDKLESQRLDLETIGRDYPRENLPDRRAFPERWRRVRRSLESIGERLQLGGEPKNLGNDRCDLRGLMSIFLAETYRFGESDGFAEAREFYQDAGHDFSCDFLDADAEEDHWNLSWAHYHHADFLHEAGALAEAKHRCAQGLQNERRKPEFDAEVLSRLWRLAAEMALPDDPRRVARRYGRAVYLAYRYQVLMHPGKPMPPDAYTVDHYKGVADSVAQRLVMLHADPGQRARAVYIAEWLADAFGTAASWRGGAQPFADAGALAHAIFPPSRTPEQIRESEACRAYAAEVEQRLAELESRPPLARWGATGSVAPR